MNQVDLDTEPVQKPGKRCKGLHALWALARPSVCFRYAGTVALASLIETPDVLTTIWLSISGFFLVAGVYAFDDIEDLSEDKINHPERPLPAGKLTVSQARLFGTICLMTATGIGAWHSPWAAFIVLTIAGSVMISPFHRFIQQHWLGRSISIFLFIVSAFLLGGATSTTTISSRLLMLAGAIGALHLATRVIRDESDTVGDHQHQLRTLPAINHATSRLFIRNILLFSAILLPLPYFFGFKPVYLLFSIPVALRIFQMALTWKRHDSGVQPNHVLAAIVLFGALVSR